LHVLGAEDLAHVRQAGPGQSTTCWGRHADVRRGLTEIRAPWRVMTPGDSYSVQVLGELWPEVLAGMPESTPEVLARNAFRNGWETLACYVGQAKSQYGCLGRSERNEQEHGRQVER
jgi:hypothetical protein